MDEETDSWEERWRDKPRAEKKLNLSQYSPEEIAKRMLETPPPEEGWEEAKKRKRKRKTEID